MSKNTTNLQDSFLNQVRKEGRNILCVLTNGAQMEGVVSGFDNFTVILITETDRHLIYKHAIAQLIATRNTETEDRPEKRHDGRQEAPPERRKRGDHHHHEAKTPATAGAVQGGSGFNKIDLSGVQLSGDGASGDPS